MSRQAAVRVRGLRKSYGPVAAVNGLDLDVEEGEIFALLGPNGAGKTTTTEILEGHRRRDSGEVRVLGIDPQDAGWRWRTQIGIVLQETNDVAELSVREALNHFASYFPAPRDPEEVLAAVGLSEKANARARQLSGGQRRRLDVALGILGDPALLFLDEPTTGFDPEVRREFWALIAGLRDQGATVLLTTHYLEEAEHLADRVAIVNGGRVVECGSPALIGGCHRAVATVRWHDHNGGHEVGTATPGKTVTDLVAALGAEPAGLQVCWPSLEDVYLQMIGATP